MSINNRTQTVNTPSQQFEIINSSKGATQISAKNRTDFHKKKQRMQSDRNIFPDGQKLNEHTKDFYAPATSLQANPGSIQSQLKKFITLLQSGQISLSDRSSRDSDKLSTIFSASEPESSSVDKQNLNSNSNTSQSKKSSSQNSITYQSFQMMQLEKQNDLFKGLQQSLSLQQKKKLSSIKKIVQGLKNIIMQSQQKYRTLQIEYEKEKKGSDQLLKALIQMDQAQKQLWTAYSQLSQNFKTQKIALQNFQQENTKLKHKIEAIAQDNQFMKKLVIVANQNYQKMDEKCKRLQSDIQLLDSRRLNIQPNFRNKSQQKCSIRQKSSLTARQLKDNKDQKDRHQYKEKQQNSSKSISSKSPNRNNNKSSYSPSLSELTHTSSNLSKGQSNLSPKKEQFDNVYRKMVMRTLKNRSKSRNQKKNQ